MVLSTHPSPFTVEHLIAKQLHVKLHVHLLENLSQVAEMPMALLQVAGASTSAATCSPRTTAT